ncbi:MAG: tRNA-binding protein [Candidatus Woesebacteria bacterium GW2011_GWB1_40_101]|uniref:tRNA-binding protein n=1 Tax=Candidatus Woesebacteria bacterium GW2011_GWB1_40_101 TaxID=1618575 RepID=A0A0G0SXF6_9BACT|nr:MAG: tRNA-binding protein [Candidatus Woesebacteria bacterium GW2011_GWB1_40_101]
MDAISFEDFEKVDIRIGTVKKAEVPEWSHWVIKLTVDFGKEIGTKTCFSGIVKFFKPEDLEKKQFPFVINLEPKKIGLEGDFSDCMMIMAVPKDDDKNPTVLFSLSKKVPNGTKVR